MKLKRILKWTLGTIVVVAFVCFEIAYWRSTNNCEQLMSAPGERMKAYIYCDYGTSEVLKLADIPKPTPTDTQVLVRVRATSINPYDWHFMRGTPKIMRLGVGLRKPKSTRLGVDFAGTVEAVGKNVTEFKPGDEVYGGKGGAFAQYVCVLEKSIVGKPANLTFEQVASSEIAGLTALQAVQKDGKVQPGQKVLINGASGGVGTFAVQIAKVAGAEVTGVCSTRNVDLVKSLGADHVIDYTKEDFARRPERYDVFLDNVPNHSLSECRRVLTPKGKYIAIGGGGPDDGIWIGPMGRVLRLLLLKPFIGQEMKMMLTDATKPDLIALRDLMASGKVKPVIDRNYKFEQLPAAISYLEQGHARGKVVVTVE